MDYLDVIHDTTYKEEAQHKLQMKKFRVKINIPKTAR